MKTIIITGSSSGFGKGLVQNFLKSGHQVIATGRKLNQRPQILFEERTRYGKNLVEVDLDLADENSRQEFIRFCQALPRIDTLINNAGFGQFGALTDLSEKQIRYQMEVNFFGTVLVTRALIPQIIKSQGQIFNFSSVFGLTGAPLTSLYCASKFALEGFSECLRYELALKNVQVCLVEPGGYQTNFAESIQWGELATPEFKDETARYQKVRIKYSEKNVQNPSEVSDGVYRLSKRKYLPARKKFGRDAALVKWSRALLPDPIYLWINQQIFKRLLG